MIKRNDQVQFSNLLLNRAPGGPIQKRYTFLSVAFWIMGDPTIFVAFWTGIAFMKHQFNSLNGKALFPLYVQQETKNFFEIPDFGLLSVKT